MIQQSGCGRGQKGESLYMHIQHIASFLKGGECDLIRHSIKKTPYFL